MARVAFIGLGNMGGPMAANLIKAGHAVTVFDLVPAAVKELTDQGAAAAATVAEACKDIDCLVSMLPAGKHVASVYLGDGGDKGVLDLVDTSVLLIDSSTIDADTARRVGAAALERGIDFVDAPVSGGVAAAGAGTLAFMCGGPAQAFGRAKEVLDAMGKNIFHAGDAGAGQIAKMCNNMLLAIHMIGSSEALRLGKDNGLDPSVLSEIMLASSGRNWSLEVYNPCPGVMENAPASNDYKPGFMVDLMCKDLGLALGNAGETGSPTPLGSLAQELFDRHAASGNGKRDFSSIFEGLE